MCLGEYATVRAVGDVRATVEFADRLRRDVSLAVLRAEDGDVAIGDTVLVAMGMVLHVVDPDHEREGAA